MKENVGLWIDHVKAFIVTLNADGDIDSKIIESGIEPSTKSTGGGRTKTPYSKGGVSVEKSQLRQQHHLKGYYEDIIKQIAGADNIYLFGPGTAKKELNHEIQKNAVIAEKIIAVDAADKMTEPQMIAKVRNYYMLKK
ncbi:hypothetical protein H8E88_08430 [candidate division KSB1 bacterium]|nr:hypothetical protein [candidate division KSB1 bacterium]